MNKVIITQLDNSTYTVEQGEASAMRQEGVSNDGMAMSEESDSMSQQTATIQSLEEALNQAAMMLSETGMSEDAQQADGFASVIQAADKAGV